MQKKEQKTDENAVTVSPEFLKIQDLSLYLGIKVSTLYAMVGDKKIPHYKVGRLVRFKKAEIDEWIGTKQISCKGATARVEKAVKPRPQKRPLADIDRFVDKSIEEVLGNRYNRHHGKPDRVKGSRREGSHGTL
jgi:excisionase family DNA binding protein